jgi:hypothetical protein
MTQGTITPIHRSTTPAAGSKGESPAPAQAQHNQTFSQAMNILNGLYGTQLATIHRIS